MDKHDIERIKQSVNIVDIIGSVVRLKKLGKNHTGLCPFHNEKTPSFTVDEQEQFYHCFGCGANGDVIKFVQEYAGIDFIDALKELGAEVDLMPTEKVKQNQLKSKSMTSYSVPLCHKQDVDKSTKFYKLSTKNGNFILSNGNNYLPVFGFDKQIINIYRVIDGQFLAGGLSYGGFGYLKGTVENDVAVVNLTEALEINQKYGYNVFIVFNDSNLKYVCDIAKPKEKQIKPILTNDDDDSISLDIDSYIYQNGEIKPYEHD